MQIAELRFCRHCINLAHVPAFVLLVHVVDVQIPRPLLVVFVVRDTDPWIAGDDVIVHRQNGRLFEMHPRNLQIKLNLTINLVTFALCKIEKCMKRNVAHKLMYTARDCFPYIQFSIKFTLFYLHIVIIIIE